MANISSTFSRPFLLLLLPILIMCMIIQTASGDNDLNFNCSSTSGKSSTYESNLKNVLDDLKNYTSLNRGFYNTSYGQGPDRVYGLALCLADVSTSDCESCLRDARDLIITKCPSSQAAIYWLQFCHMKYSNVDFFGDIDTDNIFIAVDPYHEGNNVTKNMTKFVLGLLSNQLKTATERADNHMFSVGKEYEPQEKVFVHGIVQCTGDLSKPNCRICLDYAMEQLPKYKSTEDGDDELKDQSVMTFTGSCIVRYKISIK